MRRRLTSIDYKEVPWKNGKGTTVQLCIEPESADFAGGVFDFRVSRAAVVEAHSTWSVFPNVDRVLVIVDGAGLDLTHDGELTHHVLPWQVHRFRGDAVTTSTLLDGPVRDFNVMTRRDGPVRADVEVVRGVSSRTVAVSRCFVHIVHGTCTVMPHALALEPYDSAWLVRGDTLELPLDTCVAICVSIA